MDLIQFSGKADEESDDDVDENNDQSEDDVDEDDNEDELDEDNVVDDEELQDLSDIDLADVDDDLSDMEFNDGGSENGDDLDDELVSGLKQKLQKQQQDSKDKSKEKKKGKGIDSNIFVSAEKFAEMLEVQSRARGKHGGSNTFSSSDGASAKQIDWEIQRNQRLKGPFGRKKRKHVAKQTSSNNKRIKRFKR